MPSHRDTVKGQQSTPDCLGYAKYRPGPPRVNHRALLRKILEKRALRNPEEIEQDKKAAGDGWIQSTVTYDDPTTQEIIDEINEKCGTVLDKTKEYNKVPHFTHFYSFKKNPTEADFTPIGDIREFAWLPSAEDTPESQAKTLTNQHWENVTSSQYYNDVLLKLFNLVQSRPGTIRAVDIGDDADAPLMLRLDLDPEEEECFIRLMSIVGNPNHSLYPKECPESEFGRSPHITIGWIKKQPIPEGASEEEAAKIREANATERKRVESVFFSKEVMKLCIKLAGRGLKSTVDSFIRF